jgi:hypothetical protein
LTQTITFDRKRLTCFYSPERAPKCAAPGCPNKAHWNYGQDVIDDNRWQGLAKSSDPLGLHAGGKVRLCLEHLREFAKPTVIFANWDDKPKKKGR